VREYRCVGRQAPKRQRGYAGRSDGEAAWLTNLSEQENQDGEQSILDIELESLLEMCFE
jgi:hypothetical protein